MNAHRRGACPGLSHPMPTGDGLLIRIAPKQTITPADWIELCVAAREHGNGIVEITSRGSVQVRGLGEASAPRFAGDIVKLDIAETCAVPIIADPLPEHPDALIDTIALGTELRKAIAATGFVVAPKFSIALDGGSALHLDAIGADLRLRAFISPSGPCWHVSIGGDARTAVPLGAVTTGDVPLLIVSSLEVIASRGPTVRAIDILDGEGIAPFSAAVAGIIKPAFPPSPRAPIEMLGCHPVGGGRIALVVAPAFGQTNAQNLEKLAHVAADRGVCSMRAAPARVLLFSSLDERGAAAVAAAAGACGFITDDGDPRRSIIACPGKPACGSGWIEARALAADLANHLRSPEQKSLIHISGCPKGCAHPGPASWTIVGSVRGCGIVRQGAPGDTPYCFVDGQPAANEIARVLQGSEVTGA